MPCFKLYSLLLLALLLAVINGCSTLAPAGPRAVVTSLPPAPSGVISDVSRRVSDQLAEHHSAYLLLPRNDDAINWPGSHFSPDGRDLT
jgi:hypothetical protein